MGAVCDMLTLAHSGPVTVWVCVHWRPNLLNIAKQMENMKLVIVVAIDV